MSLVILRATGVSGVASTSRDDGDPNRSSGRVFENLHSRTISNPIGDVISWNFFPEIFFGTYGGINPRSRKDGEDPYDISIPPSARAAGGFSLYYFIFCF
jgi:hypothetical protein